MAAAFSHFCYRFSVLDSSLLCDLPDLHPLPSYKRYFGLKFRLLFHAKRLDPFSSRNRCLVLERSLHCCLKRSHPLPSPPRLLSHCIVRLVAVCNPAFSLPLPPFLSSFASTCCLHHGSVGLRPPFFCYSFLFTPHKLVPYLWPPVKLIAAIGQFVLAHFQAQLDELASLRTTLFQHSPLSPSPFNHFASIESLPLPSLVQTSLFRLAATKALPTSIFVVTKNDIVESEQTSI